MGAHGGASFWSVLQSEQNRAATAFTDPQQGTTGFRHFMGALGPSRTQQFTLYGKPFDPSNETMWADAEKIMEKLAAIVWAEPTPQGMEAGLKRVENPCLPSGYTYLLQFIAHDLVHSSIFVSRNKGQLSGLANIRRFPLRLETLYGGGPTECPHAYRANPTGFRNRLRLGSIRENNKPIECGKPCLDIPRARATEVRDKKEYPEALIGDARNDSHAILSQVVMAGHHYHNAAVDWVERNGGSSGDEFADGQRNFVAAQSAMILIYREFIKKYLLRKILHPGVYAAYLSRRVPLLNTCDGLEQGRWLAPLELVYGFLRFAHSMIRDNYTINDSEDFELSKILVHNSERRPNKMPFERRWVIAWNHFFSETPLPGNNFSFRIGPWGQPAGTGTSTGSANGGLMFRDLMSSIATQPWSIGALVDQIKPTHGELLGLSDLFRHCDEHTRPWKPILAHWLSEPPNHAKAKLAPCDRDTLASDPPIPFFVRYEAFHEAEGKHLGILGSIVIADVFFGIFERDKIVGVDPTLTLEDQLINLSQLFFNTSNVFIRWSDPAWLLEHIAPLD
jgi:hypothetical protein